MKHTDPDGTAYWILPAKGGGHAAMAYRGNSAITGQHYGETEEQALQACKREVARLDAAALERAARTKEATAS